MSSPYDQVVLRTVMVVIVAMLLVLVGCGDADVTSATDGSTGTTSTPASDAPADDAFPDVIGAEARQDADGTWTFAVTISSPYDTPERYADGWRVVGPDGDVFGVRELAHDHANEQPFTRSRSGIEIPDGVDTVTIEGRDLANGWGGSTLELSLER